MDAIEDDGDGEQWRKIWDSFRHRFALGEDVADVISTNKYDYRNENRHNEWHHCNHHYRKCSRLWISSSQFIAHTNTASLLHHIIYILASVNHIYKSMSCDVKAVQIDCLSGKTGSLYEGYGHTQISVSKATIDNVVIFLNNLERKLS